MPTASIGSFFDAVDDFFTNLASVGWGSLVLGLVLFGIYLALRSRAWFHVLRAAYPEERFLWRHVWGAYMAAYGFIKVILARQSIPNSSYPALASSMTVEAIFDLCMAVLILAFAFSQGAFPKPPDFSKLNAFDLSFLASNPRFTLFLITALGVLSLV